MSRNFFLFFSAFIFLICAAFQADAQWSQMNGPNGGSIKALITVGNRILAGTDNGLFISSDTGSNWKPANAYLPDDNRLETLTTNGEYIFAGTLRNGIYRTALSDSCTWVNAAEIYPDDFITCITALGSRVFAGMSSGKLFISNNNGANWSVNDSSFSNPVHSIAMRDSIILLSAGTGLFISTDSGVTWKNPQIENTSGIFSLHLGDSVFFAADSIGKIFRSTDNGYSWTQEIKGLDNTRIKAFATEGSTAYCGSSSYSPGEIPGVFKSTDRGENWTRIDSASMDKNILSLALSGERIIAGTEYEGVFLKPVSENVWTGNSKGLCPAISCLYVTNCELLAGTEHGLFISTDGCKTWKRAGFITPDLKITALTRCNSTFFAGTEAGGIFSSIDNGETWRKTDAFDSTFCIAVNGSFILAGNTRGIQQCRVDDSVWTWVNQEFPGNGILSITAHDSIVFAGGHNTGAFRSIDYGKTWSVIDTTGFPASLITSFATCGDTVFASLRSKGVYRSTDNGMSWSKLEGLSCSNFGNLAIIKNTLIVSTYGNTYFTNDYGSTWQGAGLCLENKSVCSFFTAGSQLYAGTEFNGIWHCSVSDLLVPVIRGQRQRAIPQSTDFKIRFIGTKNIETTLEFTLSEPAQVRIDICDISGRVTVSAVNDYFNTGTNRIKWNTLDIAPGFYVAKMHAGTNLSVVNFVKTR